MPIISFLASYLAGLTIPPSRSIRSVLKAVFFAVRIVNIAKDQLSIVDLRNALTYSFGNEITLHQIIRDEAMTALKNFIAIINSVSLLIFALFDLAVQDAPPINPHLHFRMLFVFLSNINLKLSHNLTITWLGFSEFR